ncbi:ORF6N domain-containing protein [Candidatus Aalborgicola defluviihabitans]|jgi:phage regulator Rha-like protein|uniref:ORF6N domain-containing protein n=1 Tax=Candidatus Aalborgicola defluviihabitans TaxID=3386187 RepID=UPI001E1200F2|nr:ORF6N domain-containing protein [Burkholderiales bacterium]MBK7313759.1 ORF6N domain-containing protein [Burkholderiales bacterium]MBL0245494.1 ORF6N domain-containing protein [Rhodoferax sp.]
MSTAVVVPTAPAVESISLSIATLRAQRVILDADLAALYGVETKRLNEQIKRNAARFPQDFMFQLTPEEFDSLRSQFATLKTGRGQHRKYQPYVFTEHGAIMAAMVLNSARAVEVSVYVVRAFTRLRQAAAIHEDLAKRLTDLEMKTESLDMQHDTFSRNTRNQLRQVFDALQELMTPPNPPKRPIGFVTQDDTPSKHKATKAKAADKKA